MRDQIGDIVTIIVAGIGFLIATGSLVSLVFCTTEAQIVGCGIALIGGMCLAVIGGMIS